MMLPALPAVSAQQLCPVAAITEKEDIERVWEAINDPDKHVIVQTAPAVRVSLGEEFGMEPGSVVTGKLVSALKHLGFDEVFDTDFTADLTIIEEGNELLHRIKTGGKLPMLTSCSPGWINFIEQYYPGTVAARIFLQVSPADVRSARERATIRTR